MGMLAADQQPALALPRHPVAMFSAAGHPDTVWSDVKGSVDHSNSIEWVGGIAASHTIRKVSGAAEVRTHSVGLHFSWNSGYVEADAVSGKRVWSYKNRPRYGLVLPPGSNVEFTIKEKSNYRFLAMELEHQYLLRAAELQHLGSVEFIETWEYEHPLTWHLAEAIFEECESEARQGLLYSETAVTLLALHVARDLSNRLTHVNLRARGGLPPATLRRARDYMVSRLSEDLSLSEIASATGLSPGHFAFAFKQSMGIAPHAWLRRERVDTAKALLRNRDLGIGAIAISVGFANQSAFGVAFRKETGLTPTAWRRLHSL
jgi:AraC family transcriptional regulator